MATILIIDDDGLVRRSIARTLSAAGYETIEAKNGRDGMEMIGRMTPDLVITDVLMPQQDGIETILEIRKHSSVPIIAISGEPMSGSENDDEFDQLRAAHSFGANLSIRKPFDPETLLAAVDQLLPAVSRDPSPAAK